MSFGMQKSESDQRQDNGIVGSTRENINFAIPGEYQNIRRHADRAGHDPGGLEYQSIVDRLLPMGRYGQSAGADQGIAQWGRDLFSGASANRAQRGFNSPHSLEGVLGDSIRMAAPQLYQGANQFAMQRAQMMPALRQAAFGYHNTPMQVLQNLIAGSGTGSGESNSFGFQAAKAGK